MRDMTDPWGLWLLPWRAAEAVIAAQAVMAARLPLIARAMADPLGGTAAERRELQRMAPEKLVAFTEAGLSLLADVAAFQAAVAAEMVRAAPSGPLALAAAGERAARTAGRAAGAPGRAFRPLHARVTGNARRLGPRRSR